MAENVFGLGVAFRLLVQFLDPGHFAAGLGDFEAIGDQDISTAHLQQVPMQDQQRRSRPEMRQALRIDPTFTVARTEFDAARLYCAKIGAHQ